MRDSIDVLLSVRSGLAERERERGRIGSWEREGIIRAWSLRRNR